MVQVEFSIKAEFSAARAPSSWQVQMACKRSPNEDDRNIRFRVAVRKRTVETQNGDHLHDSSGRPRPRKEHDVLRASAARAAGARVHALRDDLASLVTEAGRLQSRDRGRRVRVAVEREDVAFDLAFNCTKSSSRRSPVGVNDGPVAIRRVESLLRPDDIGENASKLGGRFAVLASRAMWQKEEIGVLRCVSGWFLVSSFFLTRFVLTKRSGMQSVQPCSPSRTLRNCISALFLKNVAKDTLRRVRGVVHSCV